MIGLLRDILSRSYIVDLCQACGLVPEQSCDGLRSNEWYLVRSIHNTGLRRWYVRRKKVSFSCCNAVKMACIIGFHIERATVPAFLLYAAPMPMFGPS